MAPQGPFKDDKSGLSSYAERTIRVSIKLKSSHAGNRTRAMAVKTPDPHH